MKTYTVDPNATRGERDAAIAEMLRALFQTLKNFKHTEPKKMHKVLGSDVTS